MWMWILICLNIVTKACGYASIPFPEACGSMLPLHLNDRTGQLYKPQTTEPPFEIYYDHGKEGEPITVFLIAKASEKFKGFMLEAREQGRVDEGHPVGKFILLEPDTQLLTCGGLNDSAVIQTLNIRKSSTKANWTAQGEKLDITFRATFLRSFGTFWEKVDVNVTSPLQTTSTSKPSTTASTTVHSTTSTTIPSTTESMPTLSLITVTTLNSPQHVNKIKAAGITAMSIDSLIVVLSMELSNIFSTFTSSPFSHRLNKGLKITCSVLCAAGEILTLVLFCVGDFSQAVLIPLVVVTIVMSLTELMIVSLPFGPSHELKEICQVAVRLCAVIHVIFTMAVVSVGVFETDSCRRDENESWLVIVMAVYTAWIFLFIIWVFIFSTHTKLCRRITAGNASERWTQRRQKKKLSAAEVTASAVSVILTAGATAFTVAIVYGILGCQNN